MGSGAGKAGLVGVLASSVIVTAAVASCSYGGGYDGSDYLALEAGTKPVKVVDVAPGTPQTIVTDDRYFSVQLPANAFSTPATVRIQQLEDTVTEGLTVPTYEVKGAGGRVLMNQVNPAGSEKTIEGNGPFNLIIGAASGVRLSYNNEPVELAPHIRVDVARLTLN